MLRLIQKIALAQIYIATVLTVATWGVSQVASPTVGINVGSRMLGIGGHPSGIVLVAMPQSVEFQGVKLLPRENVISWNDMQQQASSWTLGTGHVWIQAFSQTSAVGRIGIRYVPLLCFFLVSFAVIKFLARRARANRLGRLKL